MQQYNEADRREALRLAGMAKGYLIEAYDQLASAGRWGIADMLGGNLITGLVKHGRIGGAQERLNRAKPVLDRLESLMRSMCLQTRVEGGPGEFAILVDFFFDGLIADIYVQSRVRDLQAQVERAITELTRLERMLSQ